MKAILNKTIGPNFRAGDVISGDSSRIRRLVHSGVATPDHSVTGMIGCIITWVVWAFILAFAVSTFWAHEVDSFKHYMLSPLWRWTLIVMGIYIIFQTSRHFLNSKTPYTVYFMSFSTTILGGLFIMAGHERATSRYQEKKASATAAIILYSVGAIAFAVAFMSIWNWNAVDSIDGEKMDRMTMKDWYVWMFYIFMMLFGWSAGKYFDRDFQKRRKRFIGFVARKNVTIEYKTKALNYWRAYKATGNADKFMEKNIELIEESLEVDRNDIINKKKK